jgi:hypothetical protein
MTVNISFDGGTTFHLLLGFTAAGGNLIDPFTQQPIIASTATTALPQPSNPNRVVGGSITTFATLTSSVSVTVN